MQLRKMSRDWEWLRHGSEAESIERQGDAQAAVEALGAGPGAHWLSASRWRPSKAHLAPCSPSSTKPSPVSTSNIPEQQRCDVELGAEDGAGIPQCPACWPKFHSELAEFPQSHPGAL